MADKIIEGVKIIKHNTQQIDDPDDPSYPFKLEVNLRPPEFMQVAFVMLHGGSEEIMVRGKTLEALQELVKVNDLEGHPRLRRITYTGPDGFRLERTMKEILDERADKQRRAELA